MLWETRACVVISEGVSCWEFRCWPSHDSWILSLMLSGWHEHHICFHFTLLSSNKSSVSSIGSCAAPGKLNRLERVILGTRSAEQLSVSDDEVCFKWVMGGSCRWRYFLLSLGFEVTQSRAQHILPQWRNDLSIKWLLMEGTCKEVWEL